MARSAAVRLSSSVFSLSFWLRFGVALALAGAATVGGRAQVADPTIFINEFHYDNTGTDAGEFVEIAGPAGTDLSVYSIVLYNGATGLTYLPTVTLSGAIPDQQHGFGTVHVTYAANGIQNGSPDGIALVRTTTTVEVIQFLSYEGSFTANNGPAVGLASTDIGVSELGTEPLGQSLGLTGAGDSYDDFTWAGPTDETPGGVNFDQSLGGPPPARSLSINDVTVTEGNSGQQNATFTVSLTSAAGAGGVTFTIDTADDTALEGTDFDGVHATVNIPQGSLNHTFGVPINGDTDVEPTETFLVNITGVTGATVSDGTGLGTITNDDAVAPPSTAIVINELDSDQVSTDATEFIELYDGGAGNTSLNGLSVVFYNGGNDLSYFAVSLDGHSTDANGYFVLGNAAVSGVDLTFNGNFLQNGADAVALYTAPAAAFPNGTPVTTTSLLDAVVYDTADADDPGLLVLLNALQPQVDEDALGGGTLNSIQRCPNGGGGQRNTSGFLALAPTPDAANGPCPEPPPPAAPHTIAEIQGTTDTSPFAGSDVITTGVVTGRKTNGFFLQSQAPDGDAQTSEGIFVFTNAAPMVDDDGTLRRVALGDVIEVTGRVTEFRRNDDARPETITEISGGPALDLLGEGASLPAAIPASDIFIPGAASRMAQLEPYESMLVTAGPLRVVGPTNGFGEFFAVLGDTARPFREPGITIGDPLPPDAPSPNAIPRFDGNFERVMVEADEQTDDAGTRRAALHVATGATVTGAFGPLDYAFDEYRIQVDQAAVLGATGGIAAAVPAPAATGSQFTIGSANLQNFINPSPDRIAKAALMVRQVLRTPAILAAIEVGDLDDLQALADAINAADGTSYQAVLLDANAGSSAEQNIGFLVDTARAVITEDPIQLFKGNTFEYGGVTDTLHDRPPLVLKVSLRRPGSSQTLPITLMLLHLKSLIEVDSPAPFGPGLPLTLGGRNREKRRLGAEDVADAIEARQHENLVVLGDLNAFEFNDGLGDIAGTLTGTPVPADQVVEPSLDRWDHELFNLIETVSDPERYSFVFGGSAQVLDHVLVNSQMGSHLAFVHYARNNADFPASLGTDPTRTERLADHDPVLAYFAFPAVPTSTTLASSLNPSFEGEAVTFTATVGSTVSPLGGMVEFRDGASVLDTIPLDGSGEAAFTTSALTAGPHAISATFVGSDAFRSSSASLTQTVLVDTRPVITALVPDHGPVGTPVLILGQRFDGATAVRFNGTPTPFVRLTSSLILTIVPSGATSGPVSVTAAGGTSTSAAPFTVTTPAPRILFFTPDSGRVGELVLIAGAHFTGATSVTFGTTPAVFTVIGPNLISATVPAGAVTAPITVTTPGGSDASSQSFRVRR